MRPVARGELLDLAAYEEIRERFRERIIREKETRRVALGSNLSVLFENRDTVLYQVQEMLRTERITKEAAILHELETYNELVPGPRELSITLFVEYPDADERERMLAALAGLERSVYAVVGGARVGFVGPSRGMRTDRTTAVHYLKLPLDVELAGALAAPGAELRLGVEHPAYRAEVAVPPATVASLAADLADD